MVKHNSKASHAAECAVCSALAHCFTPCTLLMPCQMGHQVVSQQWHSSHGTDAECSAPLAEAHSRRAASRSMSRIALRPWSTVCPAPPPPCSAPSLAAARDASRVGMMNRSPSDCADSRLTRHMQGLQRCFCTKAAALRAARTAWHGWQCALVGLTALHAPNGLTACTSAGTFKKHISAKGACRDAVVGGPPAAGVQEGDVQVLHQQLPLLIPRLRQRDGLAPAAHDTQQ